MLGHLLDPGPWLPGAICMYFVCYSPGSFKTKMCSLSWTFAAFISVEAFSYVSTLLNPFGVWSSTNVSLFEHYLVNPIAIWMAETQLSSGQYPFTCWFLQWTWISQYLDQNLASKESSFLKTKVMWMASIVNLDQTALSLNTHYKVFACVKRYPCFLYLSLVKHRNDVGIKYLR